METPHGQFITVALPVKGGSRLVSASWSEIVGGIGSGFEVELNVPLKS
jgi:hypothetical protein